MKLRCPWLIQLRIFATFLKNIQKLQLKEVKRSVAIKLGDSHAVAFFKENDLKKLLENPKTLYAISEQ